MSLLDTPGSLFLAENLGLNEAALIQLAKTYHFEEIAVHFPSRGNLTRLRKIAWFGSTLADIVSPANNEAHDSILREAALFNLAVALFDTVIDDQPWKADQAQRALHPSNLKSRLAKPSLCDSTLRSPDPDLKGMVDLFDFVMASIGTRFAGDPKMLVHIGNLLTTMYESETRSLSERTAAKTLPVIFIGAIADREKRQSIADLFQRLASFLSLLDDWQDLSSDILSLKANGFVIQYDGHFPYIVRYMLKSFYRLLGGRFSHLDIANLLCESLHEVISASQGVSSEVFGKTLAFLRYMLGQ